MNNIINLLILILILILISGELLINANDTSTTTTTNSNNNNYNNNNNSTSYLRRNLDSSGSSKLCECSSVVCGLCMTGCSPSTSNDCQSGRNWCYCNLMKMDCYEDKYQVCGLKPTSKPTPKPTSKPTFKPSSFSPTTNPSLGIYLNLH